MDNRSNDKMSNLAHANQSCMLQTHRPIAQCYLSMLLPRPIAHSVAYKILFLRIVCSRLGQYSFRGLIIVTATGFISFWQLSIFPTTVMWENSQWLRELHECIDSCTGRIDITKVLIKTSLNSPTHWAGQRLEEGKMTESDTDPLTLPAQLKTKTSAVR